MHNNGRPMRRTKMLNLLLALTLLAWATQTLIAQLGYGAQESPKSQERFVPANSTLDVAILELRSEATVIGPEVRLGQVCRWSARDARTLEPLGDLVLLRLSQQAPYRILELAEIKQSLRDAGVNLAFLNFTGATRCTLARADTSLGEGQSLEAWMQASQAAAPADACALPPDASSAFAPADPARLPGGPEAVPQAPAAQSHFTDGAIQAAAAVEPPVTHRTLKQILLADLSQRLGVPIEALQLGVSAEDAKAMNLAEPLFAFRVEPRGSRLLGEVKYQVQVVQGERSDRLELPLNVRLWQTQVVAMRPMEFKQIIASEDIAVRRALVDQRTGEELPDPARVIGQQAAREIKPGMILTARMIDAPQLVRPGQLVTVTMEQGGVRVQSVAKAMDAGLQGQTIRIKNEATRQTLQAVVTGPQQVSLIASADASVAGMDRSDAHP